MVNENADWQFAEICNLSTGSRLFFDSIVMENIEEARDMLRGFETGLRDIAEWFWFASEYKKTRSTEEIKRNIMVSIQDFIESHEKGNSIYQPRIEVNNGTQCAQC